MATIDFKLKNIKSPEGVAATLAGLSGSIDATTINQFQSVMDKLFEKGVRNLILDCQNIKYINSTGLGVLLKYVDQYESAAGRIAFCRVPSKVMLVMEMLGFNALFSIVPDEAVALKAMSGSDVPPASVQVRMQAQPAAPPAPVAAPPMPTISPPPVHAPAAPPPAPAPAAPPASVWPLAVDCSRCSVSLNIPAAGKYRCPRCGAILDVETGGRVRFFASRKAKPIQLSLPCTPALAAGVGQMAASAASSLGVNGTVASDIAQAVTDVCQNVIERACGSDVSRIFHCLILPQGPSLVVKITDQGSPFPFTGGGLNGDPAFQEAIRVMDTMEHSPHPSGGNVFTMSKTIG